MLLLLSFYCSHKYSVLSLDSFNRVAARCIGELSAKIPERVLEDLIPSCLEILNKPGIAPRHGACIGLSEIVQHAPKTALQTYSAQLIPAIQGTLWFVRHLPVANSRPPVAVLT